MTKFFVLIFCLFLCNNFCIASELAENTQLDDDKLIQPKSGKSERVKEEVTNAVLSMPSEYRQYIMPAVVDILISSEKTQNMSDVGNEQKKLPVRLPAELEPYAEELQYLDPMYYPLLMPEVWSSSSEHKDDEHEHIRMLSDTSDADVSEKLKTVSLSENKITDRLYQMVNKEGVSDVQGDEKNKITSSDVSSVLNIISVLADMAEEADENASFLYNFQDNERALDAVVNPCDAFISNIKQVDTEKTLDVLLEKEKMQENDFVQKCDRIMKAYRFKKLNNAKLRNLLQLRRAGKQVSEGSLNSKVYSSILQLYHTNKEDMRAIDGFEEQIEKIFFDERAKTLFPFLLDI